MKKTIDNKVNGDKRKNAQDNLKEFDEMIELIKKYPPRLMKTAPVMPYTIPLNY